MKKRRWKRLMLFASCSVLLIIGAITTWLFQEVEYQRFSSPDQQYQAVVTYRRLELFRPTFPGQSGDKPGFIKIEDKDGRNFGKVKVPMVWMSRDLEWTKDGADLKLVCEWNFTKRSYRFWNANQTEEIVKSAK